MGCGGRVEKILIMSEVEGVYYFILLLEQSLVDALNRCPPLLGSNYAMSLKMPIPPIAPQHLQLLQVDTAPAETRYVSSLDSYT